MQVQPSQCIAPRKASLGGSFQQQWAASLHPHETIIFGHKTGMCRTKPTAINTHTHTHIHLCLLQKGCTPTRRRRVAARDACQRTSVCQQALCQKPTTGHSRQWQSGQTLPKLTNHSTPSMPIISVPMPQTDALVWPERLFMFA